MLEFLRPIVIFDVFIYILLGLVALVFVRAMLIGRRERSRSIFTLERENANTKITRAFIGLMIVLGLILGVYYLSVITPTIVPPPQDTPTPTPIISLPPTPTIPTLFTPTPTATPSPPPTPIPEQIIETPTAAPAPVAGQPPNCPVPGSAISQPGNGAQVSGLVQVSGAANIDNFDYYKFEFRVPGAPEWSFIQRYNNAVPSGVLGSWNSDTVLPGEYEFRLVVVDKIGNFPEPCVVRLLVE